MHYDNSHCNNYEEFCEEIIAYMRCQNESFDFGEGEMIMEDGGEYGMYKFAILPYLNSFHENDFDKWCESQRVEKLHKHIESKFDTLSNDKFYSKLNNKYDKMIKYRKKQMKLVNEQFVKRFYVPFYIEVDDDNKEYIKHVNFNRSCDRKKKYKRNKQHTRSYQHYCEYCNIVIVYDEDTICDNCHSNFEAEGIFVFNYWREWEIMNNNDFSEYGVSEGNWFFRDLK